MLPRAAGQSNIRRMQIARTLPELRAATAVLRRNHVGLAMVPTMGALHAGHQALVSAAAATGAGGGASIFVNPTQFAAGEDLSRYPRDEPGDLRALEACGCHLAWLPDVETMYPPGNATMIDVAGPAEGWEGAAPPRAALAAPSPRSAPGCAARSGRTPRILARRTGSRCRSSPAWWPTCCCRCRSCRFRRCGNPTAWRCLPGTASCRRTSGQSRRPCTPNYGTPPLPW